ncbi:hypothetical protein MRX96_040000 [Rhipicephalus microplus]
MARHHPHLNLWQWNCRGFRAKRSILHLQNIPPDTTPSVIALHEPLSPVKLRDYTAFHPSSEVTRTLRHWCIVILLRCCTSWKIRNVPISCLKSFLAVAPRQAFLSSMCRALPRLVLPLYFSS